jgi:hypothetical protein
VSGSGAVVCSWSLLFTAIIAAFRQKFHLSPVQISGTGSHHLSRPPSLTIRRCLSSRSDSKVVVAFGNRCTIAAIA